MRSFPVYRVENGRPSQLPIGMLVERREADRGDNLSGLLKLATEQFKSSPDRKIRVDFSGIYIDL